jgi:RNA polymerase sigma-70 factor (ECF subfamily)
MSQTESSSENIHKKRSDTSHSSREDDVLIEEAISGSEGAYTALVNKYQRGLSFHIAKMVKDQSRVEDLVQETFVKAFNNIQRYDTKYAFSTWLYRIGTNHTIDYLRKKKLQTLSIDAPMKTGDGDMKMQLQDHTSKTDRKIIRSERQELVRDAIENLPEKYRDVIKLRHMQEMTYQEIVEVLDRPLGTVKAHLFRAREMLYKALKDRRSEFGDLG